jgi:soluble lytic murein transglycosylase
MRHHAADIVATLPEIPGQDADTVAHARARVFYALGDFGGAYRLVLRHFGPEVRAAPSPETGDLHRLAYPAAHFPLVQAAEREFDVSPLLLLAIMRQESGFKVRARSWANAQGLMQIIPPTGERIAAALEVEPFHAGMLSIPEVSVRFGGWYMAQLLGKYGGNVALALANYNAGPRAATRWAEAAGNEATDVFVEEIPYRETRHYVKRVLGNLWAYSLLYNGGAVTLSERVPTTWAEEPSF